MPDSTGVAQEPPDGPCQRSCSCTVGGRPLFLIAPVRMNEAGASRRSRLCPLCRRVAAGELLGVLPRASTAALPSPDSIAAVRPLDWTAASRTQKHGVLLKTAEGYRMQQLGSECRATSQWLSSDSPAR